jgi:hypothetical protein
MCLHMQILMKVFFSLLMDWHHGMIKCLVCQILPIAKLYYDKTVETTQLGSIKMYIYYIHVKLNINNEQNVRKILYMQNIY